MLPRLRPKRCRECATLPFLVVYMPPSRFESLRDFLYSEPVFTASAVQRLHLGGSISGWVRPELAAALLTLRPKQTRHIGDEVYLAVAGKDYLSRSQELQDLALALRDQGLVGGWRNEAMVLHDASGQPFAEMERAALRALGLPTVGVHLNAMVQTPEGAQMWIARRSASKAVYPGLLDNLVGGGVIGRESIASTLIREAWEEAGLHITRTGQPRSRLHILRHSAHGIQDETLHVYEHWLAPGFQPENRDGELAATRRLALPAVLIRLQQLDFTRDAALVILDGLCRQWFFGTDTPRIRKLLDDFGLYRIKT